MTYSVYAVQAINFHHKTNEQVESIASLSFLCKSFVILSTTSFQVFLCLPLCLALSTSNVTHFSPNHHHPFLKHVHIIAVYFYIPLLLCLLSQLLLNSTQDSLSRNFTSHIHLIIRISATPVLFHFSTTN